LTGYILPFIPEPTSNTLSPPNARVETDKPISLMDAFAGNPISLTHTTIYDMPLSYAKSLFFLPMSKQEYAIAYKGALIPVLMTLLT
jgi:hypothetical protein